MPGLNLAFTHLVTAAEAVLVILAYLLAYASRPLTTGCKCMHFYSMRNSGVLLVDLSALITALLGRNNVKLLLGCYSWSCVNVLRRAPRPSGQAEA